MVGLTSTVTAFTVAIGMMVTGASVFADGAIAGRVKFEGEMKKPRRIKVDSDAYCRKMRSGNPLLRESYVFNQEKGTLCNVVVYVSSSLEDFDFAPPSGEPALIRQENCQYIPHVLAVRVGQKVNIRNEDNTSHNLKLQAENNPSFNEGQPVKGMVKEVTFNKPELAIQLKCDVHSWMGTRIAVFNHPFFAVTDGNGEFRIDGLPAGEYELSVWHEFKPFAPVQETIKLKVEDGKDTEAVFTYQAKKRK